MNHISRIQRTIGGALAAAGLTVLASASVADPISAMQANDGTAGVVASTTGGGHYLIGGSIDVEFSFNAKHKANGTANGHFRQSLVFQGELIEFEGEVICVTFDHDNHRAWIGAVVTVNNSTHPGFMGDIHQPGRDVWFRVLDSGEGANADADRSTFLGFEGAAGIPTSEEYCELQIWPDNNERTSPVVEGNIQVRP